MIEVIGTDHFSGQRNVTPTPDAAKRDLADLLIELQTAANTNTTTDAQIATNTADIATNAADIATNAADIATNAADIATNVSDIADNAAEIAKVKNTRAAIAFADTPYTVVAGVNLVGVDSTGGDVTVVLPAAADFDEGQEIVVKDEGGDATAHNITVDGNADETIDGAATAVIAADDGYVRLYSNGVDGWFLI